MINVSILLYDLKSIYREMRFIILFAPLIIAFYIFLHLETFESFHEYIIYLLSLIVFFPLFEFMNRGVTLKLIVNFPLKTNFFVIYLFTKFLAISSITGLFLFGLTSLWIKIDVLLCVILTCCFSYVSVIYYLLIIILLLKKLQPEFLEMMIYMVTTVFILIIIFFLYYLVSYLIIPLIFIAIFIIHIKWIPSISDSIASISYKILEKGK